MKLIRIITLAIVNTALFTYIRYIFTDINLIYTLIFSAIFLVSLDLLLLYIHFKIKK